MNRTVKAVPDRTVMHAHHHTSAPSAMASDVTVDLQNVSDEAAAPDAEAMQSWVRITLDAAGRSSNSGFEVSIRLVNEAESEALNKQFRAKAGPTNVLSFPFDDMSGLPAEAKRLLGDLVICAPMVEREALDQGKNHLDHWAHMVVHGTLHLLGFDHETEVDALPMEALEIEILDGIGVSNPYSER